MLIVYCNINWSIGVTGAVRQQFPRTVTLGVADSDGLAEARTLGRGESVRTQVPDILDSAELTMARTQEVPAHHGPPRCHLTQVWIYPRPIVLVYSTYYRNNCFIGLICLNCETI